MTVQRVGAPRAVVARYVDVSGPVHVADFGGPAHAPVVLCVHGLGGSSAGWRPFAEALASSHRVLAVDLPGHGRTPTAGRSVSVVDAPSVVETVIDELGLGPVTLVGHSMGAAVSVLTAARNPGLVDRLLLLAPPLPRQGLGFATKAVLPHVALCLCPRVGALALKRRLARQTPEEFVRQRLALTCASVSDLSDVAAALAAELRDAYENGEDPLVTFVHAARSVGLLVAESRSYRAALKSVRAPVQVAHGALDRVLSPAGLRQVTSLQPRWETHLLPEVGHSPHLEAPTLVASLLAAPERAPHRFQTGRPVAPIAARLTWPTPEVA